MSWNSSLNKSIFDDAMGEVEIVFHAMGPCPTGSLDVKIVLPLGCR